MAVQFGWAGPSRVAWAGVACSPVGWGMLQCCTRGALQCNADDFERMAAVPSHKHACFRHMPGVVENEDGTCCAGHCHAWTNRRAGGAVSAGGAGGKGGCSAGGTVLAPERSLARISRIDNHDKNGWRGGVLPGCAANTHWLPSGDLLCPRWCITYQGGLSGRNGSRQSCFGRIWMDEVQPTVVTRAEPHNLRIVHPEEDRVLSIRENMRCQGFPDFWALVGMSAGIRVGTASIPARYMQVCLYMLRRSGGRSKASEAGT
eukprot:357392-Chlamydomonas_euryale.AAC.4